VHSAGGGVGIAATQIAKHLGGRVIGTASVGKHAELRTLGIDHLIDYRTEDFEKRSREITDGRGVDLILDPVGGESWRKGYRLLAPAGRLGAYGLSAAATQKQRSLLATLGVIARIPWFQFNPLALMAANKGLFGVNIGHMWGEIDRIHEWADCLFELWRQGVVKPKIAQTFQFTEAVQAHHFIQDRRNIGKVLLVP
jgi:NADPH:quinone reductase-like Zn-dependent oxidoreductase